MFKELSKSKRESFSKREIFLKSEEIIDLYKQLENSNSYAFNIENHGKAKEILENIFSSFEETGIELQDPESMNFKSLGRNFVRVENIANAIKLINKIEPIILTGDHENCVESNGIKGESFTRVREEGRSKINQSLIILSFNQDSGMKIKNINQEQLDKGGAVIDRSDVRVAKGEINLQNLNYSVLQFPAYLFPEERISTNQEKKILEECFEVFEEAKELKVELDSDKELTIEDKKEKMLEFFREKHNILYRPISRYIKISA